MMHGWMIHFFPLILNSLFFSLAFLLLHAGSSEAEMREAQSRALLLRDVHDHSSDSLGSSLSMSLGCRSTSVSPGPCFAASRRNSLAGQLEDSQLFGKKQALIRRSARSGTVLGPIDPKSE